MVQAGINRCGMQVVLFDWGSFDGYESGEMLIAVFGTHQLWWGIIFELSSVLLT